MLFAVAWAIVRSSRQPYLDVASDDDASDEEISKTLDRLDLVDQKVDAADRALFEQVQEFLSAFEAPDLFWHFAPQMNNHYGILQFSSSRNHRGTQPTAIVVLEWLASHGLKSRTLAGHDGHYEGREAMQWRDE